jgi:ribosome-binding factor A
MSQYRQEKVQERIQEILNTVLRFDTKDPCLDGVYVLEVRVTADLRIARIYWRTEGAIVSEEGLVPGGEEVSEIEINKALARAGGYLRRQVAEKLKIRFAPELQFHRDNTLERGERIIDIIREVVPEASDGVDAREDPGWDTDLGSDDDASD